VANSYEYGNEPVVSVQGEFRDHALLQPSQKSYDGPAHTSTRETKNIWTIFMQRSAFGDLVIACLSLDPRFAGSNGAEDDGL
jgi:hypothetical protein